MTAEQPPARHRVSDSDLIAMRAAAIVRVAVAVVVTGAGVAGAPANGTGRWRRSSFWSA